MVSHTGRLLVATPMLADPNFARSVVLVLDHDEAGALGVVLNRPTELPVQAVLPRWAQAVADPALLFTGGPCQPEAGLGVARVVGAGPPPAVKLLAGEYGLVDLDADPADVLGPVVGVRVFSGYSGWGSDQLEAEIAEGSWLVVDVVPSDLLGAAPERLWRDVLRRQPGDLAFLATMPDDPNQN